jgi:hypothetical protein
MSKCLPATLVAITIALASVTIALFVACHHHCHHHHPLCRHPRPHHHCLPTTLVAITIALFVAVAVHSPAILVTIAIIFVVPMEITYMNTENKY